MTVCARLPWSGGGIFARRRAGILLHPTSLPGLGPTGVLGAEAYRFVDFLSDSGQSIWQFLPLSPPDPTGSPYQSTSVHAADVRLVSLSQLAEWGWIPLDAVAPPGGPDARYDGERHAAVLAAAHAGFEAGARPDDREALRAFRETHGDWLDDYALFMALKEAHGGALWTEWPIELVRRDVGDRQRQARR